MDDFRLFFQAPLHRCHVLADGKIMRYRLVSDRLAPELLAMAQRIIRENGLPLEARIDEWKAARVIFDRWLTIQFTADKLIPEAY